MRTLVVSLIFIISFPVFGQKKKEPSHVFPELISQFPTVRDFVMSDTQDEVYFSAQDYLGEVSVILTLKKKKNKWGKAKIASFSGRYFDLEPFLSVDGLRLFFASSRPLNDSTDKSKDFDIWYVQRANKNASWSKPVNLGSPVNTEGNEFYPSLAQNNNLYFTAETKTSKGKEDIYLSIWKNDHYGSPFSLSDSINSSGYEFNAYIAPDESYLLFTGYNYPDGLGSGDLYISFKNQEGVWTKAQNLKEINSNKMDYCPFVDIKTQTLYFTSKRTTIHASKKGFQSLKKLLKEFNKYQDGSSRIFKVPLNNYLKLKQ